MTSRREFFRRAAALPGGLGLARLVLSAVQRASAIDPEPGSSYLDAEHVVILMQENRSFNHCFGTLRGVRGFNDPRAVTLPDGNPVWLQTNRAGETYPPFRLNIKETRATWLGSLPHSWADQTDARNHGNHDGWLDAKVSGNRECAGMPFTMGCYNREDLPFYYGLADAFTICDQHFCSSLTGTTPNRLFLWTGMVREKPEAEPCVRNSEVDYRAPARWKTFPERLEEAGISWKVYQNEISFATGLEDEAESWLANFTDNPLEFFEQYRVDLAKRDRTELPARERALHEKAFATNTGDPHYRELETMRYRDRGVERAMQIPKGDVLHQFRADVDGGKLPAVSWLVAPENFSDHPGAPWYGPWYVAEALNILTRNPDVWRKTIFVLTYDENDGYFDHVPPFVTPDPENPESGAVSSGLDAGPEYLSLRQDSGRAKVEQPRGGPIGLGYRVPMIVASPWSRGGYVCSQVFDHTSVLQLLENVLSRRSGKQIRETNISAWRRAVSGDLSSAFRPFDESEPARLQFPATDRFLEGIHKAQFQQLPSGFRRLSAADVEAYRKDRFAAEWMPRQEPGVRPSAALPYQLYAEGTLSKDGTRLEIVLEARDEVFGERSQGAPFHAYTAGAYRGEAKLRTRAYTVAAGGRLMDRWQIDGFESGSYDLHICGPNGFYRGFAGGAADPPIEVRCEYLRGADGKRLAGDVEVRIVGRPGGAAQTIHISDNGYGSGERTLSVAAGGSGSIVLPLGRSHRWYDFSVTVAGAAGFLRRYAGRVETGEDGVSDPVMGR